MRVICRLIGVPAADQPRLQDRGVGATSLSASPAEQVRLATNEFAEYVAGLVATRRNALVALLDDDRRHWRTLIAQPCLAATAAEELPRHVPLGDGIVEAGLPRRTTETVEFGGVTLRAGSLVAVSTVCANRAPAAYSSPDDLDITQRPRTPTLTFSAGPHNCLGVWLARMDPWPRRPARHLVPTTRGNDGRSPG
jgi:cytochrome P450